MRSLEEKDELRLLTKTCEKCFDSVLSSGDRRLSAYLDSLNVPAALIGEDQTVLMANEHFQGMAQNSDVVGSTLGEVMECMYAPLLGRCGGSAPCLLCRIKRSVDHTWSTGEGLRGVPVSFPHKAEGRKTFTIATEPVGGAVLLLMGTPSDRS
jgi:hypothetical protein